MHAMWATATTPLLMTTLFLQRTGRTGERMLMLKQREVSCFNELLFFLGIEELYFIIILVTIL